MVDPIIIAKLDGLSVALNGELSDPRHMNYGGDRIINLFERLEKVREELVASHPSLFGDITKNAIPLLPPEGQLSIGRKQIERLLADTEMLQAMIRSISTQPVFEPAITREGIFFAGQTFDALRVVQSLTEIALNSIWLIDNYIDSSVLDLFVSKQNTVTVKIITTTLQPVVKIAAQKFKQQYGGLEIRISSVFHDRFLCVDDRDYYHFGASIKDVGKKGFMFSRIEEPIILSSLKTEITRVWNSLTAEI